MLLSNSSKGDRFVLTDNHSGNPVAVVRVDCIRDNVVTVEGCGVRFDLSGKGLPYETREFRPRTAAVYNLKGHVVSPGLPAGAFKLTKHASSFHLRPLPEDDSHIPLLTEVMRHKMAANDTGLKNGFEHARSQLRLVE
ncbi:hypothetical protein ACFOY8_14310 [Thalassospira xianhensis]|uniref:Uncharacterized protein n=1 Tax=Thalassospira xianhensis MCCC 1A02616 TaxID=1177929 RepID=A0A367UJ49_9PROT|nr:hypothetical protein [Thalassospira xianhensis]RCK07673.1 hypothetical protein TH5_00955 [Thalassospira xianhensis MCCC 1A02616]